jgi:anti-anti-sigma factor
MAARAHPDPTPVHVDSPINLGLEIRQVPGTRSDWGHMAAQNTHEAAAPAAVEVELRRADIAFVRLRGEHDLSTKPRLTEALTEASAKRNVLVDLSECTFMDSSVIAALFLARTKLDLRDGRLELVIPREAATLQRTAEVTALGVMLRVHETQAEGLASFRGDDHSTHVRDQRSRFGDPDARAAQCSCGWQGETRTGRTAERVARRDGMEHVDQRRRAAAT